jgi:hypothetical protein
LAAEGDWSRLQRRMIRIPAEIQKKIFLAGRFLVVGITLRPFENPILS